MADPAEIARPSGRPSEAWLRSTDPKKAAEAMVRCQHAGAFCWSDGYCHYGTCFSRSRIDKGVDARLDRMEQQLEALSAQVRAIVGDRPAYVTFALTIALLIAAAVLHFASPGDDSRRNPGA